MIRLTEKATQYLWCDIGEFSFCNEDNGGLGFGRMEKLGIPESEHYLITFRRTPKGKKRQGLIRMSFDTFGRYTGIEGCQAKFSKEELNEYEEYAVNALIKEGYLEKD